MMSQHSTTKMNEKKLINQNNVKLVDRKTLKSTERYFRSYNPVDHMANNLFSTTFTSDYNLGFVNGWKYIDLIGDFDILSNLCRITFRLKNKGILKKEIIFDRFQLLYLLFDKYKEVDSSLCIFEFVEFIESNDFETIFSIEIIFNKIIEADNIYFKTYQHQISYNNISSKNQEISCKTIKYCPINYVPILQSASEKYKDSYVINMSVNGANINYPIYELICIHDMNYIGNSGKITIDNKDYNFELHRIWYQEEKYDYKVRLKMIEIISSGYKDSLYNILTSKTNVKPITNIIMSFLMNDNIGIEISKLCLEIPVNSIINKLTGFTFQRNPITSVLSPCEFRIMYVTSEKFYQI